MNDTYRRYVDKEAEVKRGQRQRKESRRGEKREIEYAEELPDTFLQSACRKLSLKQK